MNSMLAVWALVGCALISPVAIGVPQEDEVKISLTLEHHMLIDSLKGDMVTPKMAEAKLRSHRWPADKIMANTVGELVGLCEPALEKCSHREFNRVYKVGSKYRQDIPALFRYAEYCIDVKLKSFCLEHIDEVGGQLLAKTSKDHLELARPFLEAALAWRLVDYVDMNQEQEQEIDSRIARAYSELKYLEFEETDVRPEEENDFVDELTQALGYYTYAYEFFVPYSMDTEPSRLPTGNSLIAEWYKKSTFAWRFANSVSAHIKQRIRTSWALVEQLRGESLEPQGMDTIIQSYPDKEVKVYNHTVAELADLCAPSLDKCHLDEFDRIYELALEYRGYIPNLVRYAEYCIDVKLKDYCVAHIEQVVKNLWPRTTRTYNPQLVLPLLQSLPLSLVLDEDSMGQDEAVEIDSRIAHGYLQVKQNHFGERDRLPKEEKAFMKRVIESLGFYVDIYQFFVPHFVATPKRPIPTEDSGLKWYIEGAIAWRFVHFVAPRISEQIDESLKLLEKLESPPMAPVDIDEMFQGYENKGVKIYVRTAGQLAEICQETESRCFFGEYRNALNLHIDYEEIPPLVAYINYCVNDKVKKFCIERIDQVGEFLLNTIMNKEQQELVRPLVQYLKDKDVLDEHKDADIIEAYSKLMRDRHISPDEEQDFREKVEEALDSSRVIYDSFHSYLEIDRGSETKPKGDLIVTEWLHVNKIADDFEKAVSAAIKAQPELFKSELSVSSPAEDEA